MEKEIPTRKFGIININDNLIQYIFSYLNLYKDKRSIYYSNKKLRPLLDPRPLSRVEGILRPILPELVDQIHLNFKKNTSLQMDSFIIDLLQLNDGKFVCFTVTGINLIEYNTHNNSLEIKKNFPIILLPSLSKKSIQCNDDIILIDDNTGRIRVFDKNLVEIQIIQRYDISTKNSVVKLSENSFIYQDNSYDRLYSKEEDNMYKLKTEYEDRFKYSFGSCGYTMEYLPRQKLFLLFNKNVIKVNSGINQPKNHKKLTYHNDEISCITVIDDVKFATCSKDGEIKFWSIDEQNIINSTETIMGLQKGNLTLHLLDQDYMITKCRSEMKIWSKSNNKCIKTFNENSGIRRLISSKNNIILTATTDNKINVWKI